MKQIARPRPRPFAGATAVTRAALTVASPLLEKNATKTSGVSPSGPAAMFSMSRLIVLVFAVVLARQLWQQGVGGWPESTLAIAVVLALPFVNALERARPGAAVAVAKALLARFGEGAARASGGSDSAGAREAA